MIRKRITLTGCSPGSCAKVLGKPYNYPRTHTTSCRTNTQEPHTQHYTYAPTHTIHTLFTLLTIYRTSSICTTHFQNLHFSLFFCFLHILAFMEEFMLYITLLCHINADPTDFIFHFFFLYYIIYIFI